MSSENTWLIVGLGNPGPEYARTRHNIGFRCLDIVADKLNCTVDKGKFQGLYGMTTYHGNKVYLLKPLTYMNLSGKSDSSSVPIFRFRPSGSSSFSTTSPWSLGGCGFVPAAPPEGTTASNPSFRNWAVRTSPG